MAGPSDGGDSASIRAADFRLPATDGRVYTLAGVKGEKGTLIAFICNHCPYVKAAIDRFVADAAVLQSRGIGVAAIMPNDWTAYPDDAPEKMAAFARTHAFTFPYLVDETQDVARAYGAACTPDIFGFDADLVLRYRGRIDSAGAHAAPPGTRREMLEAMVAVAETGKGPADQVASIGCTIKWRR